MLFLQYSESVTVLTGFICEEHDNPADFFLDVVTHCEIPSVGNVLRYFTRSISYSHIIVYLR